MIETWRQCVTSAFKTGINLEVYYFVIGPFRGEGYIKELRFLLGSSQANLSRINAVVSGTGQGTAEELEHGDKIIERSNVVVAGIGNVWWAWAIPGSGAQIVIPMWRKVDSGARYIVMAVRNGLMMFSVSVLATVKVVGIARAENGLGVENGLNR